MADKEPIAWVYEIADARDQATGEYCRFRETVQRTRPNAPRGAMRNLRPLYAGNPVELDDIG